MELFQHKITDENGHSQFLCELLKDQNFREKFLAVIGCQLKFGSNTKITFEEQADTLDGKGRIDLFMHDVNNANALLIENKIKASDQPKQLERYSDWARGEGLHFELYYLTPYGSNPSHEGLGRLKYNDMKIISYKKHIREWLKSCLNESDKYRKVIESYLDKWNQYLAHNWSDKDQRIYKFFDKMSNCIPMPLEYVDETFNESHMPLIAKGYIHLNLMFDEKDVKLIYDKNENIIFIRMNNINFENSDLIKKMWERSNTFYDFPICEIETIAKEDSHLDALIEVSIQKLKQAFRKEY